MVVFWRYVLKLESVDFEDQLTIEVLLLKISFL